ncbi:O-fucosyltransferase family protein [Methylomonas rapida]|uniref:Tetratricopeptide repeat protein n=1 Tax=Methylomonas rapida TaxID=2963939 RepID=A0ABY7GHM6_9GAMM|nr:hypothetical protein [Methylomonas rapida]WAR44001.1 hypothetical protein NM686_016725 [Methylomonas rapida]
MIDSIFEKYRIPAELPKDPLGTLYFILRKAELAKNLTSNEWDWLDSQKLDDTISLIKTQEENRKIIETYRVAIAETVRNDLASLRHNRFVRSHVLTVPTPESERALVFFKVHNREVLEENELALIDKGYKLFLSFIRVKEKFGITEDISFDQNSVKRLNKITLEQSLSVIDYLWIVQNRVFSVFHYVEPRAKSLFSRYQCNASELAVEDFFQLCLILQKLEEGSVPAEIEQEFLVKYQCISALESAQRLEFIALKKQFRATQFASDDPSQHLFKVLRKLRDEKPLTEPDINYLKKRKLIETLKFIYKPKADALTSKVKQGHGLTDDDIVWCKEHNFEEIIFLSLKIDYQVRQRNDSIESPLYSILVKLNASQRLSGQEVAWLETEELFRPNTQIFVTYHRLEALHAEAEFKRTKGFWNIVNASADWRKANQPESALKLTNNQQQLRSLKEAKLRSALFTTRGGALRDLDRLSEAEQCALEAINHYPNSHNPYTLMGALCYDTGRYGEGDEWFEKAIERGAKPNDQDSEIKRILQKKKGKERQEIIQHLLAKDHRRFAWVKRYAQK